MPENVLAEQDTIRHKVGMLMEFVGKSVGDRDVQERQQEEERVDLLVALVEVEVERMRGVFGLLFLHACRG
jgi:hypothetical protein